MKWPYVLGLVYSIVLFFMYTAGQVSPEFMLISTNIVFPATAGAAVAVSFLIVKRYVGRNPKPAFSMAWASFASGLFLWFLGDLIWAINVAVLNIDPFPSLADVVYLGGYIPMFISALLILKVFQVNFPRKTLMLQISVPIALSAVVSYLLVVPVAYSSENPSNAVLLASYPILDVGLFAVAFSVLLVFIKGTIGKAWFFLTLGIVLNIVADLFFTYALAQDFYYEGHPIELLWLLGYVAFTLGLYVHRREL